MTDALILFADGKGKQKRFLTCGGPVFNVLFCEETILAEDNFQKSEAGRERRTVMEREEKIRSVAYSIWETEGYPAGRDLEHWLKAETICNAEDREEDRGKAVRSPDRKRGRANRAPQKRASH